MGELVLGLLELVAIVVEAFSSGPGQSRERRAEKLKDMKPHPFDALDDGPRPGSGP
jgi:hypothetical protein